MNDIDIEDQISDLEDHIEHLENFKNNTFRALQGIYDRLQALETAVDIFGANNSPMNSAVDYARGYAAALSDYGLEPRSDDLFPGHKNGLKQEHLGTLPRTGR